MRVLVSSVTLWFAVASAWAAWAQASGLEEAREIQAEVIQLEQQGRYEEAIPLAERVVEITERIRGKDHVDVATALDYLALLYQSVGADDRAEPLFRRSLAIREGALGGESPEITDTMDRLAQIYLSRWELSRAESLYERSLAIRTRVLGDKHLEVATSLNNLAKVYDARVELSRAKPLYERSLAIREEALGPSHPEVAVSLSNLAALYVSAADYAAAERLYLRALEIEEEKLGEHHPTVAMTLAQLAVLYQKLGDYDRAEASYGRAVAILEKHPAERHRLAASYTGLASLYETRGDYGRAEPLLRHAAAMYEGALGRDDPEIAAALNNLGMLYAALGEFEAAEPLYRRSLTIRERALGRKHPDLAASLNNLARLYEDKGELSRAEPLYEKAAAIYREVYGDKHPDTEAVISNTAGLLLDQGRLDEAHQILGSGAWPTGLGRYYLLKEDFHGAYAQLVKAVDAAERSGESRHLLAGHIGLGLALEGLGEPELAMDSYRLAVDLIETQRSALSPIERTRFLSGQVGAGFKRMAAYEGLVRTTAASGDPGEAMRWAEYTKARQLLEATGQSRSTPGLPTVLAAEEERLTARLRALYRQREAALARNPELFGIIETQWLPDAGRQLDAFVDELRGKYPSYAAYRYPQPVNVGDVVLRSGEVLLEYSVTERETFAWLVRDRRLVEFARIPLGRDALAERIREYRALFRGIRHTADLRSDVEQGRRLYDLLVRDLVAACAPGETLMVIPDGSLGLLPFEALVVAGASGDDDSDIRYLGDVFSIVYAQSATVLRSRRALKPQDPESEDGRVMVLADPVFDHSDDRWPKKSQTGAEATFLSVRGITALPRLEKTEELLAALEKGFGSKNVDGLIGLEASERRFRQMRLGDYRYLVLATHGVLEGQLRYLREPALVLAQSDVDRSLANSDGLLTLSEVMELQLGAEVAALTACDTGVGKKLDGEGVMGLGWAFQYAGARNVVMSLWSVDQAATVRLMKSFFLHLQQKREPREALRIAQGELRNEGYAHPFFWAPFILMGEG